MPFKKGESGNPGGRKKSILSDALRSAMTPIKAKAVALTLLREAEGGNMQAMSIIFDRIEGKPVQSNEHSGEGGGPIRIVIETVDDRSSTGEG